MSNRKLGVYGRTVTRKEFRKDPVAILREAARKGAVTIVDADGNPQAVISVPAPVKRVRQ